MGEMHLIYKGFSEDVNSAFKSLIEKYHFQAENASDYGVTLINKSCQLKIFCEVSLIIWYFDKKEYKDGILLTHYFYNENKIKYEKLNAIYFKNRNNEYFKILCDFLIEDFSEELSEK